MYTGIINPAAFNVSRVSEITAPAISVKTNFISLNAVEFKRSLYRSDFNFETVEIVLNFNLVYNSSFTNLLFVGIVLSVLPTKYK